MSATLDSDMFAGYYSHCPVLTAGGRTFPVQQQYLEDAYELTGCAPHLARRPAGCALGHGRHQDERPPCKLLAAGHLLVYLVQSTLASMNKMRQAGMLAAFG